MGNFRTVTQVSTTSAQLVPTSSHIWKCINRHFYVSLWYNLSLCYCRNNTHFLISSGNIDKIPKLSLLEMECLRRLLPIAYRRGACLTWYRLLGIVLEFISIVLAPTIVACADATEIATTGTSGCLCWFGRDVSAWNMTLCITHFGCMCFTFPCMGLHVLLRRTDLLGHACAINTCASILSKFGLLTWLLCRFASSSLSLLEMGCLRLLSNSLPSWRVSYLVSLGIVSMFKFYPSI
jgi:hypothetical protein